MLEVNITPDETILELEEVPTSVEVWGNKDTLYAVVGGFSLHKVYFSAEEAEDHLTWIKKNKPEEWDEFCFSYVTIEPGEAHSLNFHTSPDDREKGLYVGFDLHNQFFLFHSQLTDVLVNVNEPEPEPEERYVNF